MDEGWGNIIYLILLAIVGIFSSIKKKKKPIPMSPPDDGEVAEQVAPQTPNQESKFDSVFEVLLGQQIPEPYLQENEEELIVEEEVLDSVPEQKDPRESSIEYVEDTKTSTFDALKNLYQEEEEEIEEREEIDWRQAIIYKEILDRKYN
ncbi:MAG: hypothetical protein N4A59_02510 [Marinifilum sp.]|jgi:hypothetical protein|nr:hypothetical protein [Marinifilum sp.]